MGIDPVVLFFVFGLFAGLVKSELKLPPALYETLSIVLLLAIGLHGGVELAEQASAALLGQSLLVLALGVLLPILAFFLLEMGLIASGQLGSLKRYGFKLAAFALLMPLIGALIGALLARFMGLSLGGTAMLATLAASASYIAVPAAMRLAVPEANPSLSLTASLGITFPFNILIGIPLYLALAERLIAWGF